MKDNLQPHPSGIIAVEDWQLLSRSERHLRVFRGELQNGEPVWGTACYVSVSLKRPRFEVVQGCTYDDGAGGVVFLTTEEATGLQLTLLHRAWLSLLAATKAAEHDSDDARDYEGALRELLFVASKEGIHQALCEFAEELYHDELLPMMLKKLGGALLYDAVSDRVHFKPMGQL